MGSEFHGIAALDALVALRKLQALERALGRKRNDRLIISVAAFTIWAAAVVAQVLVWWAAPFGIVALLGLWDALRVARIMDGVRSAYEEEK